MSDSFQVYFDGHCRLCQFWVRRLFLWDKKKKLIFISLQSQYASKNLPSDFLNVKTIVYKKNGQIITKSDAVLQILMDINPLFKLLVCFKIFPRRLRDFFYDFIAKNRFKWFGRSEKVEVPYNKEPDRFILE